MPETTQSDLVEREEMQVSAREHPDVSEHVLREAIKLARERGGQTIPVSDYDILRARDTIAGEQSEVTRLTAELHAAKEEAARLRAHCEALAGALGLYTCHPCPICNGDCSSAMPPVLNCPTEAAVKAFRDWDAYRGENSNG